MKQQTLPILGIEYEFSTDTTTNMQTGQTGQCTHCGTVSWLSHKRGQYLCHSCFYGTGSQPDPIVDDIRHTLVRAWYSFRDEVREGCTIEEAVAKDERIQHVICPECTHQREPEQFSAPLLDNHICDDCITGAIEDQQPHILRDVQLEGVHLVATEDAPHISHTVQSIEEPEGGEE